MKGRLFTAAVLLLLGGCLILWAWRIKGTVLLESAEPSGGGVIKVRALQPKPASLNGLLGRDEVMYRCEFYREAGKPMVSCQSFYGEKFYPHQAKIGWQGPSSAWVLLGDGVGLICDHGRWTGHSMGGDEVLGLEFPVRLKKVLSGSDALAVLECLEPLFKELAGSFAKADPYNVDLDQTLPKWFTEVKWKGCSSGVLEKGFLGLDEQKIIKQTLVYFGVSEVAQAKPDMIPEILARRMDESPSRLDVLLYLAVRDGLVNRAAHDVRTEPWIEMEGYRICLKLGAAKNPIYRLLAAENARRLGEEKRITFLAEFAAETDPLIRDTIADGLKSIGQRSNWF